MGGEEKTFKVNFSSDGIQRLMNEVTEKLKEFMGDYTDDTLVVCLKGSVQPETPSPTATTWPRAVPRGFPYPVPRFSRGNLSSFRGRGIVRPGPRSLQWKRDAQPAHTNDTAGVPLDNGAPTRSFTYVRPELKSGGDST